MKKSLISTEGYPTNLPHYANESSVSKRKDSFSFEKQREKFIYIDSVGELISQNIPHFRDIWPLLGAYTNDNNVWHHNLNEHLEIIGIAHYTMLKSLCYILNNKDLIDINDPDQRFKNVMFHYSIINEVVIKVHEYIWRFKDKYNDIEKPFSYQVLRKVFSNNNNCNAIDKLKGFYSEKYEMIDSFVKFRKKSQPVRNLFAHDPTIDIFFKFIGGKWEKKIVRPDIFDENTTIRAISKLDSAEELVEPIEYMHELFQDGIIMLERIWTLYYEQIEEINSHPEFENNIFEN